MRGSFDEVVIRDRPQKRDTSTGPILDDAAAGLRAMTRWVDALAVVCGTGLALAVEVEGSWFTLAAVWLWLVAVVVVVRSDLIDFIIPDGATAGIAVLGLANSVVSARDAGADGWDAAATGVQAASTGCLAFVLFWGIGWFFRRFGRREALGFGDVKLAGALALWLAPADAALALEVAALAAIAVLMFGRRTGALRDTAVPFGAFMAPAAWLAFLLGPAIRSRAGWPW